MMEKRGQKTLPSSSGCLTQVLDQLQKKWKKKVFSRNIIIYFFLCLLFKRSLAKSFVSVILHFWSLQTDSESMFNFNRNNRFPPTILIISLYIFYFTFLLHTTYILVFNFIGINVECFFYPLRNPCYKKLIDLEKLLTMHIFIQTFGRLIRTKTLLLHLQSLYFKFQI